MNIHSDVNVFGSLICRQSISSVENVTAGMKLASLLGVETLGPITSAVSVWSPLTQGLIVMDSDGTMDLIRMIYNAHIHFAPNGATTDPSLLM